tara:strand:+ start:2493 stop:2855 length:363 start_codon:yes stop_codon:yes gene_type:complete
MHDINITGKVVKVKPIQIIKTKNGEYRKQNFIVKLHDKYENFIEFTIPQKRLDFINVNENDWVDVKFFINGKQWNDKIIHNFNAIKVDVKDYKTESDVSYTSSENVEYNEPKQPEDDLPF